MIFEGERLLQRFTQLLEAHTHVDIATAWATGGEQMRRLEDVQVSVRAIVGTSGWATRPDALERRHLITRGNLRILNGESRLFHPKLYLYRRVADGSAITRAFIGSPNFTNSGFGSAANRHEELVLEVGPGARAAALAEWFPRRWDDSPVNPPVEESIRLYKE